MRRPLPVVAILAAASFAAQRLDHDPVPMWAVPLVWGVASIGLLVAFAGVAAIRRFVSGHKGVSVLLAVVIVGALAAMPLSHDIRLTTFREARATPQLAQWLEQGAAEVPLPPTATALVLARALRGVSHSDDFSGCSAFLRPDETLGPRFRVRIADAINTSRNDLTPEVARLRAALLDMERVPAFKQAGRVAAATPAEARIVELYDLLIREGTLVAREQRRPERTSARPPRLCVYGFAAARRTPFIDDFERTVAMLPPDTPSR